MTEQTKSYIKNLIVTFAAILLIVAIFFVQIQNIGISNDIETLTTKVGNLDTVEMDLARERGLRSYWQSNAVSAAEEALLWQARYSEAAIRVRELSKELGVSTLVPE